MDYEDISIFHKSQYQRLSSWWWRGEFLIMIEPLATLSKHEGQMDCK